MRIPGQPVESGRHLHNLYLLGSLSRDVVNKDVLIRILRKQISARVVPNVVSARENQQRISIWADGGGDRLTGREIGRAGQIWVEGGEMSPRSCGRSDTHARRQIGRLGGAHIVVVRQAACFNVKQRAASGNKDRASESKKNEP